LIGGILSEDIYLLISQTFIGKFVEESAPPTVQVLILLFPIGKVD